MSTMAMALIFCSTLFSSETCAQRAAVGIGSKLKRAFLGGGAVRSDAGSVKLHSTTALQGEENDVGGDDSHGMWETTKERIGIVVTLLAILCGSMYLFLIQHSRINEIEQTISGGECQAYNQLCSSQSNNFSAPLSRLYHN